MTNAGSEALAGLALLEEWPDFAEEALELAAKYPEDGELRDEVAAIAGEKWDKQETALRIWNEATAKPKPEPKLEAKPKAGELQKRRRIIEDDKPTAEQQRILDVVRESRAKAKAKAQEQASRAEVDLFILSEAQPEIGPESESQPNEAGAASEQAKPRLIPNEAAPKAEGEPVLSKRTPMLSAREFARRHCRQQDFLATYFYEDAFWKWNGNYYKAIDEAEVNAEVYAFLDRAKVAGVGDELTRFQLMPRDAEAVLKCLKAGLVFGLTSAQRWLESGKAASSIIAFKNYLLDYETGEVMELTPKLWITDGLDFAFDPKAKCPRWEQFLEEVFPGDLESQQCIEEQLGYGMTNETKFEKGALWIGKKTQR